MLASLQPEIHNYADEEKYLQQLDQDYQRMKKQPELFIPEISKYVKDFHTVFAEIKDRPTEVNRLYTEISLFLAKLADRFQEDLAFLPNCIISLLETHGRYMNTIFRRKLVALLMCMASKRMIEPETTCCTLLPLLTAQDKKLRQIITGFLIKNIRLLNKKRVNQEINRKIMNAFQTTINSGQPKAAEKSLAILINLYQSGVWTDDRNINLIATGCFLDNYKANLRACYFLRETTEAKELESSDEEDYQEPKNKHKEKNQNQHNKNPHSIKKRLAKMKRKRQHKSIAFFPIDRLYNPAEFSEKLFLKLQRSHDPFPLKLAMMALLSRLIGRNQLSLLSYFQHVTRYLHPQIENVQAMLAYLAESCHEQISIDDLQPIIKQIIQNFLNERNTEIAMTMGINCLREIAIKIPLILDSFHVNYIADFTSYKNRNVSQAAKSIINLYRDINPSLLEKRHRGRLQQNMKKDNEIEYIPTKDKICTEIDGAWLLGEDKEIPIYRDRILDDKDFKKIRRLQRKGLSLNERQPNVGEQDFLEDEMNEETIIGSNEADDLSPSIKKGEEKVEIHQNKVNCFVNDKEEGQQLRDLSSDADNLSDFEEEDVDFDQDPLSDNNQSDRDSVSEESEESDEDENPHGFIDPNMIGQYRKTKAEMRKEKLDTKESRRALHKYRKKPKHGGTNNKEKTRLKPQQMMRQKLRRPQENITNVKHRIKKLKRQLGHQRDNHKQRRGK